MLARLHEKGKLVSQNRRKGMEYNRRAEALGNGDAVLEIAKLYEFGIRMDQQDDARAIVLLERHAI